MGRKLKDIQLDEAEHVNEEARESWGNPVEFFLTLVSYCVGPGNILRFPYLCMRNGGAAFLIPYFICLFVCGVPLYTLELIMGQASRKGCLGCWTKYGPSFKGVGYTMILISVVCTFEYQTYQAWILYYFARSLTWQLPWTTCNATWNTPNCILTTGSGNYNNTPMTVTTTLSPRVDATFSYTNGNQSSYAGNHSIVSSDNNINSSSSNVGPMATDKSMTAVEEFFQFHALGMSSSIDEIGPLQWPLVLANIVGWIVLIFCLIRGIRSSGKVVYVAALLPYVIITVFLVRAASLPGFEDGVRLYVTPNFEALKSVEVWMMAFLQIFFSLGPGWGCMISMSSFSNYHHNFMYEALFCPIVCCLTSFYAGFVTFGTAGFLARVKGVSVEEAMSSGPGIAFISFPELAAHLPGGPIWSAIFFVMMFNVLIGGMLVQVETCVNAVMEAFNFPKRYRKYVLILFALVNVVGGLVFFTKAGMYIFQLVDWYFALIVVFCTTGLESVCVMWFYGFDRFQQDVYNMIGRRPWKYFCLPLCGVFIPATCLFSIVWSLYGISAPTYGDYKYPNWSLSVGCALAVSMTVPILLYVLIKLLSFTGNGFKKRLADFVRPKLDESPETVPMNTKSFAV